MPGKNKTELYQRIQQILESARVSAARSVNMTQVMANWLIGREIVEKEQRGKRRAGYGEELLKDLSDRLTKDREKGWSVRNLEYCRNFYMEYPLLIDIQKSNAVRSIFTIPRTGNGHIPNALRSESKSAPWEGLAREKGYSLSSESWQPGHLHPNLSWTHYRTLLRVEKAEARAFYEIEAPVSRIFFNLFSMIPLVSLWNVLEGAGRYPGRNPRPVGPSIRDSIHCRR
jgi:predicted nuclease of restriction endonuclease-like (RecB) superfamily